MIGFEYYNPAKIVFGEDSEQQLTALLKENHISSLLLVYSGDFIKDLGIYAVIEKAVKELGIAFSENGNVVPNPEVDLVRQLVEQGKKTRLTLFWQLVAEVQLIPQKLWHLGYRTTEMFGISLTKAFRQKRC